MKKAKLIAIRRSAKGSFQGVCDVDGKTVEVSLGADFVAGSDILVKKVKIDGRYVYIGYQAV